MEAGDGAKGKWVSMKCSVVRRKGPPLNKSTDATGIGSGLEEHPQRTPTKPWPGFLVHPLQSPCRAGIQPPRFGTGRVPKNGGLPAHSNQHGMSKKAEQP